jgi:hypothetical protein
MSLLGRVRPPKSHGATAPTYGPICYKRLQIR